MEQGHGSERPSTSSALNVREEYQIERPTTTSSSSAADVENQPNAPVNIAGGEFQGAQLIGSQTTHQHHNLTKKEYNIDQRQQHIHFYQPQPPKSQNEDSLEQDCIRLSDSIRMFYRKKINKTGNVFHGKLVSSVTGSLPLAIKSLQFDEKNKREAQILTKLRPHKHVVSIVHSDVYYQGAFEFIYIAMELCHQQNLHDHVTANKNYVPFNPQLSIFQAKQLVEGLNHIHSNNIIHRDLKPHNVLFSIDHQNLKIADFGISKPMTRGLSKTRVTNVGAGTDGYRAPEIFNNYEISQKADIYSLGLVFYFLWSNGLHPFGDDSDEWNINIKKNRGRDLSHLMVPDQEMATDLLQWMLQFEACNRPTTAQILKHRFFKDGSLVSPGAETSPKAPATSSASGARSKLRSSSSSDVGRYGDEQQASTSTEQPKETSSSSVMTAEQRSETATLASTPTSATETKRKLVNYWTSDVGNQPSTNGVQKKRRVSEPENQAEKMIETADKANLYFGKGQYQTAEGYLKKVVDLQKYPWQQLETLQQIAECHVMLDQPCANDINNIISTCQSLQLSPDVVRSTANKHLKDSHLVRAYVMSVCASTMYRSCDAVVGIMSCTWSMGHIVEAMKNQPRLRMIASSQVIASMYDMLDQLREIKDVSDDVKEVEARCLNDIGISHYELCEYNKALDNYNKAMKIMQSKFGSNSVKYRLFGRLLNNIGNVYSDHLNDKVEAVTYYLQSIDAYQKAEDYSTEEQKQKSIETTKNNLQICQNKFETK